MPIKGLNNLTDLGKVSKTFNGKRDLRRVSAGESSARHEDTATKPNQWKCGLLWNVKKCFIAILAMAFSIIATAATLGTLLGMKLSSNDGTDINECYPNPCQNGGTCTDGVNSYTCTCVPGFNGTDCQTNKNDCSPNPCQNGGSCTDGVNLLTCSCVAGFTGTTCQTNINECYPNPCQNDGTCTDGVNSYTCTCVAGFNGTNCQTNINVCSPNPCQNGGSCTDDGKLFTCSCVPGFTGTTCESKLMEARNAWQSSTFSDCDASKAIDGKLDEYICTFRTFCGCLCAHTDGANSAWVMEFWSPGFVKTIVPFFRITEQLHLWRNKDFSIYVHNSFEDGKNGVNGTLCTTYTGTEISFPTAFTCSPPIYGHAVRIQDFKSPLFINNGIQICEIKVLMFEYPSSSTSNRVFDTKY